VRRSISPGKRCIGVSRGGSVGVSYAAPQAHEIANVALHWEYSSGVVFIFFQGRKDLFHV
jgi:hypothetical protein